MYLLTYPFFLKITSWKYTLIYILCPNRRAKRMVATIFLLPLVTSDNYLTTIIGINDIWISFSLSSITSSMAYNILTLITDFKHLINMLMFLMKSSWTQFFFPFSFPLLFLFQLLPPQPHHLLFFSILSPLASSANIYGACDIWQGLWELKAEWKEVPPSRTL